MTETTTEAIQERREIGYVDLLRNGPFLRLWIVQALSQTGQNTINFALLILVRDVVERHSLAQANTAVGLMVLAFSAPAIVFSPFAGVVIERANKRTALIVSNALRGLAVLGFLVVQTDWRPLLALLALYLITFTFGAVGQFFGPALGAAMPALVPAGGIVRANALFNLTFTASQLAGFAVLGPFLIRAFGVDSLLVGIVGVFVLCTILSLTIPSTPPAAARGPTATGRVRQFVGELREAGAFILQHPILVKAISYLSLATASTLMLAVLGPQYVTDVLGFPTQDIAYLMAPAGVGVVVGGLFVARVASRFGQERTIDVGLTAGGVLLASLALVEPVSSALWSGDARRLAMTVIASILAVLLGVANAVVLVPSQALLQSVSAEHVRARVYAAFFTVSNGVAFLPIIFAGALADLIGVAEVLTGLGVLVLLVGIIQLLRERREAATTADG